MIAGDILQTIGSAIAVRSDTFRVRAYGENRNKITQEVEGRAWCEAIVQRIPEPVEPEANTTPNEAAYWEIDTDQDTFGRKFKIISFRWLDPSEV